MRVYNLRDVEKAPEPELSDVEFWRARWPDLATFTYFIQAEGGGPVKIGLARDPQDRLALLQTGNPQRLVVRELLPVNCEWYLHQRHAEHRLVGEWFANADRVLADAALCVARLREWAETRKPTDYDIALILEPGLEHRWLGGERPDVKWSAGMNNPELVRMLWREGWRIDQIAAKFKLDEELVAQTVAEAA